MQCWSFIFVFIFLSIFPPSLPGTGSCFCTTFLVDVAPFLFYRSQSSQLFWKGFQTKIPIMWKVYRTHLKKLNEPFFSKNFTTSCFASINRAWLLVKKKAGKKFYREKKFNIVLFSYVFKFSSFQMKLFVNGESPHFKKVKFFQTKIKEKVSKAWKNCKKNLNPHC